MFEIVNKKDIVLICLAPKYVIRTSCLFIIVKKKKNESVSEKHPYDECMHHYYPLKYQYVIL